jgi:hypothetical protein
MSGPINNSGSIEAFCQTADQPVSRRSLFFDEIHVGDRVLLCFAGDDTKPPYSLKIRAPSGALILERMIRELPTGRPQSEPPIEFVVSAKGAYLIEVKEVRGTNWGKATLTVV